VAKKQPEPFVNSPLLPLGPDKTVYRKITNEGVTTEQTNLALFCALTQAQLQL
jgi:hypothetical protein